MTPEEKLATVLMLADEIGSAWRGDWNDFDGRTLRGELADLGQVAAGEMDVVWYRAANGLCPHGRGHWTDYCDDGCGGES